MRKIDAKISIVCGDLLQLGIPISNSIDSGFRFWGRTMKNENFRGGWRMRIIVNDGESQMKHEIFIFFYNELWDFGNKIFCFL